MNDFAENEFKHDNQDINPKIIFIKLVILSITIFISIKCYQNDTLIKTFLKQNSSEKKALYIILLKKEYTIILIFLKEKINVRNMIHIIYSKFDSKAILFIYVKAMIQNIYVMLITMHFLYLKKVSHVR